jgi:membrane protease YdiL (CAAX protease family)
MLVVAFMAGIGAVFAWPQLLNVDEAPIPDAVLGLSFYVLLAAFLWLACMRAGILNQISFGPRPSWREMRVYILFGIPLIGIAVFGLYVLYMPLSYIFPSFVIFMLLDVPPVILWRGDFEALLANGINTVMIVVIAPVIEEIFFRGFLLNRWWRKYGIGKAIIFSSMAFAVLHVDIIGGMVFGIVLSIIYVKTKSLIGPIVAHVSNNAIAVLLEIVFEGIVYDDISEMTLDEFRTYWWLAAIGAAVGVPWLVWFFNRWVKREFDVA